MKKLSSFLAACTFFALLFLSNASYAFTDGLYISPKLLLTIQSTEEVSVSYKTTNLGGTEYHQLSYGGGGAIGYDWYKRFAIPVRTEVEYIARSYLSASWSNDGFSDNTPYMLDQKIGWSASTLLFNVYWDFHNSTRYTPYIGAGLGMGFVTMEHAAHLTVAGYDAITGTNDGQKQVLAWNFGGGCSISVTENFSLDLGLRFVGLAPFEIKSAAGMKTSMTPCSGEIVMGFRYTF